MINITTNNTNNNNDNDNNNNSNSINNTTNSSSTININSNNDNSNNNKNNTNTSANITAALQEGALRFAGAAHTRCRGVIHYMRVHAGTANLRTKILDFRGFDSSRILILRGGILMSIGDFPEVLSHIILVGMILVGRLGIHTRATAA